MLRPMDTISRFGGDEFTLLFEDLAGEREALLIADRISRAAQAPIALADQRLDHGQHRHHARHRPGVRAGQ